MTTHTFETTLSKAANSKIAPRELSPDLKARIAGACYLAVIIGGFFAIGYVPGVIMVRGDVAATARNLLAHEFLYRLGILIHILFLPLNLPMGMIFYDLFKVVNKKFALLALFCTLAGTAIEAATLLSQFVPLILLEGGHYASALTPTQLQALAYLPLELQASSFNVNVVFFVVHFFLTAYLIIRSSFLPRILGVLLAIGGLAYLIDCVATILAPEFAAHLFPYIQLPSLIGEGSLCLWLLLRGVNVEKWKKDALESA